MRPTSPSPEAIAFSPVGLGFHVLVALNTWQIGRADLDALITQATNGG
jgi:hypothetical protein